MWLRLPNINISQLPEDIRFTVLLLAGYFAAKDRKVLLVGGCIRDMYMGIPPKDFDVEIFNWSGGDNLYSEVDWSSGNNLYSMGMIKEDLDRLQLEYDTVGEAFGVIKLKHLPIDISLPRRENKRGVGHKDFEVEILEGLTVEEAAKRRDFTMNSMSFDPLENALYDPFAGRAAIDNGILHPTDLYTFIDDPLRVLRGFQFAARFNMKATYELTQIARDNINCHE
ncbi:unnamed protein product, partial [marine sediment metagenome]